MFSRQQKTDLSSPSSEGESEAEYGTARTDSVGTEYEGVDDHIGYSEAMSPGTTGLLEDLSRPMYP